MNDFEYAPIKDQDGVGSINLGELFKLSYDDMPWLVESYNCIYLITNLINEKRYVGKASYFYGRFVSYPFSHIKELMDPDNQLVLNRALRKYKPKNFIVEVIESDLPDENLNDREIYWISHFNTNIRIKGNWGYNMTYGGNDTSQMNTPVARKHRRNTNIELYGHPMGRCLEPKIREYALQRNRENHGGVLSMHTPEAMKLAQENSYNSRLEIYGEVFPNSYTPEAIQKKLESNRRNHGGVLAYHTPEAIQRQLDTCGGVYAIHTEYGKINAKKSRVVNHTKEKFELLRSLGTFDAESFIYKTSSATHEYRSLIPLFGYSEYYSEYDFTEEEFRLLSDIYEYCYERWPDWTIETLAESNPFAQFKSNK